MIMETHHHILNELMRQLHMMYIRENHTIGNFLFMYLAVFLMILFFLLAFEVIS